MNGRFRFLSVILFLLGAGFRTGAEDRLFFDIVPRVETSARFGSEEGYKPNFGYTSLYSSIGCRITDKFGVKMNNRWLTTNPSALYKGIGNTRDVNWLDILDFSYNTGRWHFDAGKLYIRFGGFEFEAPNWDFHHNLESNCWMNLQPYTWGATVGYDVAYGNRLSINVNNSPFSGTLFKNMLLAYSFAWDGQVGPVQTYWGFTLLEKEDRSLVKVLGLGQRLTLYDDYTAELDYTVKSDDWNTFFSRESSLVLKLAYEGQKWFQLHLKGGWEFVTENESVMTPELDGPSFVGDFIVPILLESGRPYFFGGFYAYFYPLKNNKNLRLHVSAAANNYYQGAAVNAGLLYRIDFSL